MSTWRCPYCNQNATLTSSNVSYSEHLFDSGNLDGQTIIATRVQVCPNQDCKRYILTASLYRTRYESGRRVTFGDPVEVWRLKPDSFAKPIPEFVPTAIRQDYSEACLIERLSPKASATLSRRCLQGMIRDFYGIVKSRLIDEINALEEKTDPLTWTAIDAVRKIGNVGAHMEKDIDLIIDVEPSEARLLIELIETLIDEWYVERHARELRMNAIIAAAAEKTPTKSL